MRRFTMGLVIVFLIGLIAWIIMGNYMWDLAERVNETGVKYVQE